MIIGSSLSETYNSDRDLTFVAAKTANLFINQRGTLFRNQRLQPFILLLLFLAISQKRSQFFLHQFFRFLHFLENISHANEDRRENGGCQQTLKNNLNKLLQSFQSFRQSSVIHILLGREVLKSLLLFL